MPVETPSGARLLVVDDNEMNRDMLSRRLVRQGHTVEMAENGQRALEMLGQREFDLVLLDIMMPGMDGYQVLERLKEDGALSHIPVVMISALQEIESVVKCLELGAEDYLPKPFNPTILKARVDSSLVKKRFRDREREWAKSMERELDIGREIQAGFLPEALPTAPGWEIAARFGPARQCAGDFYDAFEIRAAGGVQLGLVVADVCDKGVGAALFMALFRSLLRALATQERPDTAARDVLASTISFTNDYIARTHGSANMFATTFFAVLDPATGALLYVNAGHEAPLVMSSGTVREHLSPTGPALGMLPEIPFGIGEARLAPGETLVAFTDGVTEAKGEAGFYGEERLLELLAKGHETAEALLAELDAALALHTRGFERSDDITILAVRRER